MNEKKYYFEKKMRFFYFLHINKEMKTGEGAKNAEVFIKVQGLNTNADLSKSQFE